MKNQSVISRGEALQILKNDLRKRAIAEHAGELNKSPAEDRAGIMSRIERDIAKQMRKHAARVEPDALLH